MKKTIFLITTAFILTMVGFYSCKKDNIIEEPPAVVHGDGTADNPYIISTPAQLDAIRDNLSAHYKLGKNIDLTAYLAPGGAGYAKWGEEGWRPIGTLYTEFTGSLDGADYKITGLWINRSSTEFIGLFGFVENGTIKNIEVKIANDKSGVKGYYWAGGVAGHVHRGSITSCCVIGAVSGFIDVGGVVGRIESGNITNCYATGTVSGNYDVGGVLGTAGIGSIITNCYATSVISSYNNSVGGVAGYVNVSCIANCYFTGTISGNNTVGGMVGRVYESNITNCYATGTVSGNYDVGGVLGIAGIGSIITNCYAAGMVSGSDYVGGVGGGVGGGGIIANCVALTPSITANSSDGGRVVGELLSEALTNNWARSDMSITVDGANKILDKGSDK